MFARRKQNSLEDKYKFITYILNKIKLPTEHRQTKNKDKKEVQEKDTQGFGARRHHCAHAW